MTANIAPKKEQIAISGREGWLFLDQDSNHVLKQIQGKLLFPERKLAQWQYVLETRFLWLRELGISYFFMVAPNKECVYPEYLPEGISLSKKRTIRQLIQHQQQKSFFQLLYPLQELRAAKTKKPVYRKMDTHWNHFGAFQAYRVLMHEISKSYSTTVLEEDELNFIEVVKPGDLGTKLGIPTEATLEAELLKGTRSTCVLNNCVSNRGNLMVFENQDKSLPRAVMFRDSFATQMLPFLAESFSRLVVVWQPNIDYTLVLKEKPEIVISQQVERYLVAVPNDSHGSTNAEFSGQKKQSQA